MSAQIILRVLVTGLFECDVCATVWLFTRAIADLEKIEAAHCRRCGGPVSLSESTLLAVAVTELPPIQPPVERSP